MANGPIELPADVRQVTAANFGLFTGYMEAGFTTDQALYLVGCWITGSLGGPRGS